MPAMWPGHRLSNPRQGRLQPPWEAVWVNEFAPANAMVGIADKSAPVEAIYARTVGTDLSAK